VNEERKEFFCRIAREDLDMAIAARRAAAAEENPRNRRTFRRVMRCYAMSWRKWKGEAWTQSAKRKTPR